MSKSASELLENFMARFLTIAILVATCIGLSGCTDAEDAKRALEGMGYSDIEIKGYAWTGCGGEDNFRTAFKAVGPTGKAVTGVGCSGWWKGTTIRFD
jgi:hypothetical protein